MLKDVDQSIRELLIKIQDGSQDLADFQKAATLLAEKDRYEEAIELYKRALSPMRTNLEQAELHIEISAISYEVLGDDRSALSAAQRAVQTLSDQTEDPDSVRLLGLGHGLIALSAWDSDCSRASKSAELSLRYLGAFVENNPESLQRAEACWSAARVCLLLGMNEQAVLWCRKGVERNSSSLDRCSCLLTLAETLRVGHRLEEALAAVCEVLPLIQSQRRLLPLALLTKGLVEKDLGQHQEALASFELGVQAERSGTSRIQSLITLLGNIAEIHYEQRNYDKAIEYFEEASACAPAGDSQSTVRIWLGRCYQEKTQYNEAISQHKLALDGVQSADLRRKAELALAEAYYAGEKYDNARDLFVGIFKSMPEDSAERSSILLWLGNSHLKLGEHRLAIGCYQLVQSSPTASVEEKALALEGMEVALSSFEEPGEQVQ